jgi:hypothetical protein
MTGDRPPNERRQGDIRSRLFLPTRTGGPINERERGTASGYLHVPATEEDMKAQIFAAGGLEPASRVLPAIWDRYSPFA